MNTPCCDVWGVACRSGSTSRLPMLHLSKETTITTLLKYSSTVATGTEDRWAAHNRGSKLAVSYFPLERHEPRYLVLRCRWRSSTQTGLEMSGKIVALLEARRGEMQMFA